MKLTIINNTTGKREVFTTDGFAFDDKVTAIDAWYDRHTRDYCIQLLNADGCQVGDAVRVGNKADKDAEVEYLKAKYNLQ